jgi:hypothetical protein
MYFVGKTCENRAEMKTYYKPTVAQRKRMIYRSIDPAEPKRQRIVRLIFLAMIVLVISAAAWLDH